MIIEKLGKGKRYAQVRIDGTVLTVGERSVDCAEEQQDSQRIMDIKEGDAYSVTIILPPKEYEAVAEEDRAEEQGQAVTMVAKPIDMEAVRLSLWPLEEIVEDNKEMTNGNYR